MADEEKLPAESAGETGGAASATTATPAAAESIPLLGADESAEGAVGEETSSFDKWREEFAGGDKTLLKQFERMNAPAALGKAYREMHKKLSAGQTFAPPPEDALPEEMTAYRKRMGIPEAPDGYAFAFTEEMKPTEGDTFALTEFKAKMHAAHVPPQFAQAAFDYYKDRLVRDRQALAERVQDAKIQGIAELRSEWKGREFNRNIAIGYEFLEKHLGDKAPDLARVLLADGRTLGDHEDFVRFVAAAGRATQDEDALIAGDGGGGGKSLDDEFNELVQKAGRRTPAEQARAMQLAEARVARDERQGRGQAA